MIIFMVSNSGAILSPGRDGLSGISPNSGSRVSKLLFAAAQPFYALVAQSRVERAGRCEVVAQGDGHAVRGIEPSGG